MIEITFNWSGVKPALARIGSDSESEEIFMTLSIVALFLSGVALGMNVWALSIAMKHLMWKDGKDTGNGGDDSSDEG